MEMKKINSGKLRAIGYDARARMLQVQLDDGSMLQYSGVGEEASERRRENEADAPRHANEAEAAGLVLARRRLADVHLINRNVAVEEAADEARDERLGVAPRKSKPGHRDGGAGEAEAAAKKQEEDAAAAAQQEEEAAKGRRTRSRKQEAPGG